MRYKGLYNVSSINIDKEILCNNRTVKGLIDQLLHKRCSIYVEDDLWNPQDFWH